MDLREKSTCVKHLIYGKFGLLVCQSVRGFENGGRRSRKASPAGHRRLKRPPAVGPGAGLASNAAAGQSLALPESPAVPAHASQACSGVRLGKFFMCGGFPQNRRATKVPPERNSSAFTASRLCFAYKAVRASRAAPIGGRTRALLHIVCKFMKNGRMVVCLTHKECQA